MKNVVCLMIAVSLCAAHAAPALARPGRTEFKEIAEEKRAAKQKEIADLKAKQAQTAKEGRAVSYNDQVKLKKAEREERKKNRLLESRKRTERVGLGRTKLGKPEEAPKNTEETPVE